MGRGGPGQRRRLAELSERSSYRLNGVQKGSIISMCLDRYGRWDKGFRTGMILKQSRDTVWILWENDGDPQPWPQGDVRYEVDRGRARIVGPQTKSIFSIVGSGAPNDRGSLTEKHADASIMPSPPPRRRQTEERDQDMSDTLSAKQVATRIGTDPKTFRRFLRSAACTVEPVGQGGRYEFDSTDLDALKKQFLKWRSKGKSTQTTSTPAGKKTKAGPKLTAKPSPELLAAMEEDDDEDFDADPTDDDLAEIEDLDLDLDEEED